jgi:tetratricopeptide (TPR) repeat protein
MTGRLGRIRVGGSDCGAGFALGPRRVVTALHVVRGREGKSVAYVPAGGKAIEVERVVPDPSHDAAVLWLAGDVEFSPTRTVVQGAEWRVESPPPRGNDPPLHGTVTTGRMAIQNASGQLVEVVQLEVSEHLGDFGGYSGSAVLDSLGRAVLALLVEQKPLRTPVALGERQTASNVLYAVPIGDVITALGLPVRAARPTRFDVGLLPPGMVARHGLLDEAVGHVVGAKGGGAEAGLVVLRGPGGAGKTVLARQVAGDVRVWAEFPDGIIVLRAGQTAAADGVARQLQEALGYRDRNLVDVLDGQRLLLVVDDVWDRDLLATLQAGLPSAITILATTRGVFVPGAVSVPVGAVSREEAIQILARDTARSSEVDRALGDLSEALFRWALLLNLAAADIHRDDELAWELSDTYKPTNKATEPGSLVERSSTLQADFPADPTMLDDLERAPEGAAPRSVDVLVRRSLEWLGPEHCACFELLAVYPSGAAITQRMLEDLWQKPPKLARKEVKLLLRAGLVYLARTDHLTIALHDLITAWLHHTNGRADDPSRQPVHHRLAGLCMRADDSPGELTKDRAEWLAYHLVSARAWDRLTALPTLRWRTAFLVATGSDAVFLAALDAYARAARTLDPAAVYPAIRAWLFASHVRALIETLPIQTLEAMAVVSEPIAAITQACQHPKAELAVSAVLAAVPNRLDTRLLKQAGSIAEGIPEDQQRSAALAAIAGRMADLDPVQATALFEQAVATAGTIPQAWGRNAALIAIVRRLADVGPASPALLELALAVAEAIPEIRGDSDVWADIAARLADIDPARAMALFEQAVATAETASRGHERARAFNGIARRLVGVDQAQAMALLARAMDAAETIPDDKERSRALADITWSLADIDPAGATAMFERALVVAETISDDRERGDALAGIAGRLAATGLPDPALLQWALAVAESIPQDWHREQALARVTGQLANVDAPDPRLFERAVAVAETITGVRGRNTALASIAEALAGIDPAQAMALLERAMAIAGTLSFEEESSRALAGAARRLAGIDPAQAMTLFDRAAAAVDISPYPEWRSEALADIAKSLAGIDPAQAIAMFERAIDAAETIPDDEEYSWALAGIAQALATIQPASPGFLERAAAVAETIPDDTQRSKALARIARALATIDPPRAVGLLEQALTAAKTIRDHEGKREWALARFAGRLTGVDPADPQLLDLAVAVAESIPYDRQRSDALADIAEMLAVIDPDQALALLERARALTETIPDVEGERGAALESITRRLAGVNPADPQLLDQAVAMAQTISHPAIRSDALANIAGRLAGVDPVDLALLDRAVTVAETIPHQWSRSDALALIVSRLADVDPADPWLLDRAVTVAETIPDDAQRSEALAGVAGRLTDSDPVQAAALLDRAVTVAKSIRKPVWGEPGRGWALADIAERLAGTNPRVPALIDQAVAVAGNITNKWRRSCALDSVAQRLADVDPIDPTLLKRALAIAVTIPDDDKRGQTLAHIVWRLAEANPVDSAPLKWALAVANTIPDDWKPHEAIARIHAINKTGMLDELSRWRNQPLEDAIDIVSMSLKSSRDNVDAQMIGLAVLHVASEFST